MTTNRQNYEEGKTEALAGNPDKRPCSPSYDAGFRDAIPHSILISNDTGGELLRIHPDGTVTAPSLEAASEAGRVFVESIREQLSLAG